MSTVAAAEDSFFIQFRLSLGQKLKMTTRPQLSFSLLERGRLSSTVNPTRQKEST